ncbi:MAG: acyl carrier protein [Anaerolineae bacterium]|nr:acyl carrier protein [Anaerolineae bacterium]
MDIRQELKTFITKEIMRNPKYPLKDAEPLISGGLIDSFSLVEVQLYIEKQFGVWIDDMEMTVATCNTVDDIAKLIEARQ